MIFKNLILFGIYADRSIYFAVEVFSMIKHKRRPASYISKHENQKQKDCPFGQPFTSKFN
jgi:hypothetical protein